MRRVAILGGSFNPVHLGHLLMAQSVLETGHFDQIVFLPSSRTPHKDPGALAPAADRLAMLRLAIGDNPAFSISEQEIARGGVSYAVDTLCEWRQLHPAAARPGFIIGMDSLIELHTWHRVADLLPLCTFITLQRPGFDAVPEAAALRLPAPWPERLLAGIVPGRRFDVSSSEIRQRVAENRGIRYLVPDSVARYIAKHGLYHRGA